MAILASSNVWLYKDEIRNSVLYKFGWNRNRVDKLDEIYSKLIYRSTGDWYNYILGKTPNI